MHGRIKTRTTAEQNEAKRLEREKKVKAYKNAMKIVSQKRLDKVYDQEALDIISGLLLANPDIITLWNYRREIYLNWKKEHESETFQKIVEKDLSFTEQCLRVNPKSYGTWHHRIWILDNLPEPNWKKELVLCTRYLELDERNFHCWDYRKIVTQRSNVPDHSEYEYTLEKIKANFSNYSAWHLRSKLLPKIFPDHENKLPITEEKHKEELELVQSAAFTDPNDQSAWFYQQWLLGMTEPKIHFVAFQTKDNQIIVALSKNIKQDDTLKLLPKIYIEINGAVPSGKWSSSNRQRQSSVWIFNFDLELKNDAEISLKLLGEEEFDSAVLRPNCNKIFKPKFVPSFSKSLIDVLKEQLSSCEELLEMEPDSKWTLLTSILLKKSIDLNQYQNDIIRDINKLIEVDRLRQGYYEHFLSKFKLELALIEFSNNDANDPLICNLSNMSLSSLYHMQYLVLLENVDLSGNNIIGESLSNLHCLQNCMVLNLNNNKIESLMYLPILPKLKVLRLDNNLLEDLDVEALKRMVNLKKLTLENNPVVKKEENWKIIEKSLGELSLGDV